MRRIIGILLIITTFMSCFVMSVADQNGFVTDEGRMLFDDVRSDRWYAPAVEFCYNNDIINGISRCEYAPERELTRSQFVMMLANIEGVKSYNGKLTQFTDVRSAYWYYDAVAWAYDNGIVSGMSNDKFGPDQTITRAQISRMMMLYMEKNYSIEIESSCLDRFTDKDKIPEWALDGMEYVVSAGLITGMSETTVVPEGTVTRAQAARILMLFMQNYKCGACEHIFTEATCTEGKTCSLCGLVTSLPNGHIIETAYCTYDGECRVCGETVKAAGHNYGMSTCQMPSTCRRCGVTDGGPSMHRSTEATCTEPGRCPWCNIIVTPKKDHSWNYQGCGQHMICKNCGTQGMLVNHNWSSGNCTIPKNCVVCGKTDGDAPGHKFVDGGNCTVCGMTSPYQTLWYAVKKNGVYDYDSHSFTYARLNESGNGISSLIYSCSDVTVYTMYMKAYADGSMAVTLIEFAKNGTVSNITYIYTDSNGNVISAAEGFVDAATFKNGVLPSFSYFEGNKNNIYNVRVEASKCIDEALKEASFTMKPISGYTVSDFGFKNY